MSLVWAPYHGKNKLYQLADLGRYKQLNAPFIVIPREYEGTQVLSTNYD